MTYFTLKNGEQIYYEDTGKGAQTLVLLHGWSSNHEVYAPVVEKIRDKVRCISYDQRGHGKSKDACREQVSMDTLASDLNELINGLGLKDITLLGWSMGAAVAIDYTGIYGCGALKKLILCDMTPKQLNDENWKLGLYQGRYTKADMEKDTGKDFYNLYKDFAKAAVPKLAKVPDIILRYPLKERLKQTNESVLRSLSRSMKEKDFREYVGKINTAVDYYYAVPGSLFSPELAAWYEVNVRSPFKAVAFRNSTHMLISDHPDQFAEEVLKSMGL